MAYVNIRVLRLLKEELAWVINKWLQVISNKMLFITVVPLRNQRINRFKFNGILYALLCDP